MHPRIKILGLSCLVLILGLLVATPQEANADGSGCYDTWVACLEALSSGGGDPNNCWCDVGGGCGPNKYSIQCAA